MTVENSTGEAMSSWEVRIYFNEKFSISNSWNANVTVANDGMSLTATNKVYNGSVSAGGCTAFGMQGAYSSSFATPSCTFIK